MSVHTDTDCLLRGIRDAVAAEGYQRVDSIALADLALYAVQMYDRGEGQRCRILLKLREFEAAGRAALESEAGR